MTITPWLAFWTGCGLLVVGVAAGVILTWWALGRVVFGRG